jgi:hypothetical protein
MAGGQRAGHGAQIVLLLEHHRGHLRGDACAAQIVVEAGPPFGRRLIVPGELRHGAFDGRHEDRRVALLLQPAGQAEVVGVHVRQHDAVDIAAVDAQFTPGRFPDFHQLGPVQPRVEDRPAVAVVQQIAVDMVEREGQRQPHLEDGRSNFAADSERGGQHRHFLGSFLVTLIRR